MLIKILTLLVTDTGYNGDSGGRGDSGTTGETNDDGECTPRYGETREYIAHSTANPETGEPY